jgi:hypothetical protein
MLTGALAENELKSPQHEVIYKVHRPGVCHWTACFGHLEGRAEVACLVGCRHCLLLHQVRACGRRVKQCWCAGLPVQVYRAAPQTLLPVLPHLARQLGLQDETRRLAAVDLLGPLFSIPGSQLDAENTHLFTELLLRFTDQKVPSQ